MIYEVRDLTPEQKRAAELLLGHTVSEDEAVIVKSLGPSTIVPARLSPAQRVEALRALDRRFAKAPDPGAREEEEEAAVNEALASSRPGYRPAV